MHLVSCAPPQEPLEAAPRTALLADRTDDERWDGFWSADTYYVRCTTGTGDVTWYQLADDVASTPESVESRVLPLRPRSRVAVVIAKSPDGRRMLVGSTRRSRR